MSFKITDHVEFNASGRAICPSCAIDGKGKKLNLALVPNTDGAYKCHRGCEPEQIRNALGQPKSQQLPKSQEPKVPPKKALVSIDKVSEAHQRLMKSDGPAKEWLNQRGIDDVLIETHYLGVVEVRIDKARSWAISIPIKEMGTDGWHLKKRVAPWDDEAQKLEAYQPWKQYGIPKKAFFAYFPDDCQGTYLCEGEWDAIMLGDLARKAKLPITVACFTCGCGSVPPQSELAMLPKPITVFYDRNDQPLRNGTVPGEAGAQKAAIAFDGRAKIAKVPMPDDCTVKGWDISDAINSGYKLEDFQKAASEAIPPKKPQSDNSLRDALIWNDDLVDNAPDYTEFLVPEIFTEDELFLIAAPPREGKSLFAMTLAHAVATGGQFLGRPTTQGTVIYVKSEDSHSKIKEREKAQGWARGLPVAWLDSFKLSNIEELEELVKELDPRLIVLDTLSRIKDSNVSESSAEMSQMLDPLQSLANKYGCCIVLVHHTGKVNVENLGKIDVFDTIRGSSAIRAVCRGSMIIAKGEHSYRLIVENGWGKLDLKVVLDANTLTWQQLGEWSPVVNMSQQDQIITALTKLQVASVDQLHDETGIDKKSLYTQLSRLVNKGDNAPPVIKEGSRRNYTYRLALYNTSQQLTKVLTSGNPSGQSVTGYSQQNTLCTGNALTSEISTSEHVPVPLVETSGQTVPPTRGEVVDYSLQPPLLQESYSQHASQQGQNCRLTSPAGKSDDLSSSVPVADDPDWNPNSVSPANILNCGIEPGQKVRYTGGNSARARVCGRKKLTVVTVDDGLAIVTHKTWIVTQSIDVSELAIAQ